MDYVHVHLSKIPKAPANLITVNSTCERFILYSCSSWRSSLGTGIQGELFTIVLSAKNTKETTSRHRKKWIFPDHFFKPSHTLANKLSIRHTRTANTHMSLRIHATWSGLCCLLKQEPQREICPYATWEQRISIWACGSVQSGLEFVFCWKKKCAETWELPHENREYPHQLAHLYSLIWTSLPAQTMRHNMKDVLTPHASEQRIPIWACASAHPDLEFAVC